MLFEAILRFKKCTSLQEILVHEEMSVLRIITIQNILVIFFIQSANYEVVF